MELINPSSNFAFEFVSVTPTLIFRLSLTIADATKVRTSRNELLVLALVRLSVTYGAHHTCCYWVNAAPLFN
jgi:hypothetical protein